MILNIVSNSVRFGPVVTGAFSFTEASLRKLGKFEFSNKVVAGTAVDEHGNNTPYWDVQQAARFSIEKFTIAKVTFSFEEISFQASRKERVTENPNPLENLALHTDARKELMQMQYQFTGGAGRDTFDFGGSIGGTAHGGMDSDSLTGGLGDDNLYGDDGNDVLIGGGGHDLLDGGNDDDNIFGSLGQRLIGGDGVDFLQLDLSSITSDMVYVAGTQRSTGIWLTPETWVQGFEAFDYKFGAGNDHFDLSGLEFYTHLESALDGGKGTDSLLLDSHSDFYLASVRNVEFIEIDYSEAETWRFLSMATLKDGVSIQMGGFWTQATGVRSLKATGGVGDDTIVGTKGADRLSGGAGNDIIEAGVGDVVAGGSGHDTVRGSVGSRMDGGVGRDTLILDLSHLKAGIGFRFSDQKKNWLTIAPDTTIRNFENMSLTFGKGDDAVDLRGASSNGGIFNGGAGKDTFKFDSKSLGTYKDGRFGLVSILEVKNFEDVDIDLGGYKNVVFNSLEGSKNVQFESGTESFKVENYKTLTLTLGWGNDEISGTAARDFIRGNKGDDVLKGGRGKDLLSGGDGDDIIYGSFGSVLAGGAGRDVLYIDQSWIKSDQSLAAEKQANGILQLKDGTRISGFERIETTLGAGDDNVDLRGMHGGKLGSDRITTFKGGRGDDVLQADHTTRGRYSASEFEALILDLSGSATAVSMKVGERFPTYSAASMEIVFSGKGRFDLTGTKFADTLYGGKGADQIAGGAGDDLLVGGGGHDMLRGDVGNDTLEGGKGRDQLFGAAGNDVLIGGRDNDVLTGGSGRDLFFFAEGHRRDVITDFAARGSNHDIIDLSNWKAIAGYDDLVKNHMKQTGADVFIDGGNGDTVLLKNVNAAHLVAADFIF